MVRKNKKAKWTVGFLTGFENSLFMLRVYNKRGPKFGFKDYEIHHPDLKEQIIDSTAEFVGNTIQYRVKK